MTNDNSDGNSDGNRIARSQVNGRVTTLVGGKRVNVYLDRASIEAARVIGNGQISVGIRLALAAEMIRISEV